MTPLLLHHHLHHQYELSFHTFNDFRDIIAFRQQSVAHIVPMSFLAAMCGMNVSKVLRNSALLLVFAVGSCSLFSEIVRQCGRQFATTTNKIISGGQLHMVQNLSWQVTPPWIPPKIEEKRVASGIRASAWCNADCRAKFVCKEDEVKICFWDKIFGVVKLYFFYFFHFCPLFCGSIEVRSHVCNLL